MDLITAVEIYKKCKGTEHCLTCYLGKRVKWAEHCGDICDVLSRIEGQVSDTAKLSPGCKWSKLIAESEIEPERMRAGRVHIEYNGKKQSLSSWAREMKISRHTLRLRHSRGWPVEEILYGRGGKKD